MNARPDSAKIDRLESTPDGGTTYWSARYGQHYHNRNGALAQAQHVFLEGSRTNKHPSPQILEIGFGLGLNFLTTLADATRRSARLDYLAYEFDPQAVDILRAIGARHPASDHPVWLKLLDLWPKALTESALRLNNAQCSAEIRFVDVSKASSLPENWATAVYLDGFSPKANPELWSVEFLARLAATMQIGGWLATYSAAGAVRRGLKQAGLQVTRCPGVAGKHEFLCAQRS